MIRSKTVILGMLVSSLSLLVSCGRREDGSHLSQNPSNKELSEKSIDPSSSGLIAVKDDDGRTVYVTPEVARQFFASQVQVRGQNPSQLGQSYSEIPHMDFPTSGTYAHCRDYAEKATGGIGHVVSSGSKLSDQNLQPGQVLHLTGSNSPKYNWGNSKGKSHYVVVEKVNPNGTVQISHSNFGGNKGVVREVRSLKSFQGHVTVYSGKSGRY